MTKKALTSALAAVALVLAGSILWIVLQSYVFPYETVKGDGYSFKAEKISEKDLKDDEEFPIPPDEVDFAFMLAATDLKFPVGSEIKSCYLEDPKEYCAKLAPETHWNFETFPAYMYCIKISVPLDSADDFYEYMCQMEPHYSAIERDRAATDWFGGEEYYVPGTYIERDFLNKLTLGTGTRVSAYATKTEQEYLVYFLI